MEDDVRGRKAESDVVGQGVELFADRGGDVQQACRHAVEEVEHGSNDDKQQGCVIDTA